MPVPVYLPKFDSQHEESRILQWTVAEGDSVHEGDPLCEVETDKVNMEVEAPADGELAKVVYAAGEVAPAATVIAFLLLEGETTADLPTLPAAPDQPVVKAPTTVVAQTGPRISPVAKRMADLQNIILNQVTGSGPGGLILRRDVEKQSAAPAEKVRATPAARHLARLRQLDLGIVNGSGPRGRVQAADVQVLLTQHSPAATEKGAQTIWLEGMRERIARRVQQSYQRAPHIFVEMLVDMTQIEALRQQMKAEGEAVSITTMLVKACAWTLKRHPRLNATLVDDSLTLHPTMNIGIVVALDEGLIVPVILDADKKVLAELQRHSNDLVARAREGNLKAGDVAAGTFTISNLGMFGVSRFTAIINPPQVAILAVGRITKQFVPDENDQPVLRPMMTLVLSVDHRVIDGTDAARFLDELRHALEQPVRLLW